MPIDIQSYLQNWGIDLQVLAIAAVSFVILFALSLREFLSWYLRTSHLARTQRDMLARLKGIEDKLQDLQNVIEKQRQAAQQTSTSQSSTPPLFPLGSEMQQAAKDQPLLT